MSALADHLRRSILAQGPLPLSVFMAQALGHPQWGYYTGRDPLGAGGDFTTSPEISQMFGELLGLWCGQVWLDQGCPGGRPGAEDAGLILAELGPGRGTLMADALRALAVVPGMMQAATVCLVEISPVLRQAQAQALAPAIAAGWTVRWYDEGTQIPPGPLLLLANEFFDALPIRQFQRGERGWSERLIGLDGDAFIWVLGPPLGPSGLDALVPPPLRDAPPGAVLEVCPAAAAIAADIATRIRTHGGGALVVDYGYAAPALGDTLQAMARHRFVPPLDRPGEVDLTAHVDFTALAQAATAAGAQVFGPITQAALLDGLGLAARAQRLAARATPAQAQAITAAAARLTAADTPTAMGALFKALAIVPPTAPAAPAFPAPFPPTL